MIYHFEPISATRLRLFDFLALDTELLPLYRSKVSGIWKEEGCWWQPRKGGKNHSCIGMSYDLNYFPSFRIFLFLPHHGTPYIWPGTYIRLHLGRKTSDSLAF